MTSWQYYDFINNWDLVRKVWLSEHVQDFLQPHMISWCEHEAYFNSDGKKPQWKRKDDLWTYSRTDFHDSRINDAAEDFVEKNNMRIKYKKAVENFVGREFLISNQELEDDYFDRAMEAIYEDFKPKPGSIIANILQMGCDYIVEPLFETAKILFPDDEIMIVLDNDDFGLVINPDKKIIFDWIRDFHYREGSENLSPEAIRESWNLDDYT